MALSCDDPGLVIRQPLGSCILRIFNHYVEESQQLDALENITKFDVVRFYRSSFPHKRDKDPALHESAIAELVKGEAMWIILTKHSFHTDLVNCHVTYWL